MKHANAKDQGWWLVGALLLLSAVAWIVTIWQSTARSMSMGLTMGLSGPVFLAIWVAMMVAMMFPSASPMIATFGRVSAAKRARGQAYVPASIFTGAYLFVWGGAGLVAYILASWIQEIAMENLDLMSNAGRIAGSIFLVAGIYQLSPAKGACLRRCRSPLTYVLTSWREGYRGAVAMGIQHGLFCLGCCWLLFVMLFPLGIMNVAAMAVVAALVLAEKVLPKGEWVAYGLGLVLIVYGAAVIIHPSLLPQTPM